MSVRVPGLVGVPGFEPGTSASRTQRAAKLRHTPMSTPENGVGEPYTALGGTVSGL